MSTQTSTRKTLVGALRNRLFGDGDRNAKTDCDRENAAVGKVELGNSSASPDQDHEPGLNVRTSGPFFEGPVVPGVMHVHSCVGHESLQSSVVGASEGSDSAGSPSGDSAEPAAAPTLSDQVHRLIATEAVLAEHLPQMRTKDRMELAIELRQILNGSAS